MTLKRTPAFPGCVIMAKVHQNRHDDLRFLLQIRGERRKIPIATQPAQAGVTSGGWEKLTGAGGWAVVAGGCPRILSN